MLVKQAKDVARDWVAAQAQTLPGFHGAYFAGSINWLPDDATLSQTSDVDLMVVLADSSAPPKLGKTLFRDALLDVTYLASDPFQSAETMLGDFQKAPSFVTGDIVADPSGALTALQTSVSRDFTRRTWVEKRCDNARSHALRYTQLFSESVPLHDQVIPWLFSNAVMAEIPLVAGLKNPTVRRRYLHTRLLLAQYGHSDLYSTLLESLGCTDLSAARTRHHLTTLTPAFDEAKSIVTSPFPFAADISDAARPIAIDGSRELIDRGDHREAVFWIVATYSRCRKVLHDDGDGDVRHAFNDGYRALLADLGITSFDDVKKGIDKVKGLLPRISQAAEAIIAANPDIER
jgi:hypothetical protein